MAALIDNATVGGICGRECSIVPDKEFAGFPDDDEGVKSFTKANIYGKSPVQS
jgi:hypothetical protein